MCGRYTLTAAKSQAIRDRFELRAGEIPEETLSRFNVCPTEEVLVVAEGRKPLAAQWGLRFGAQSKGRAPINARSETATTRPGFARLIAGSRGRCLVVADGWYEWLRAESPKSKPAPFRYTVDGGEVFTFAGLINHGSVAILTTDANALCRRVHDRMPCVLAGSEEEAAWLSPGIDGAAARELLAPLAVDRVAVAAANPRVNRAGEEGSDLLEAPPSLLA